MRIIQFTFQKNVIKYYAQIASAVVCNIIVRYNHCTITGWRTYIIHHVHIIDKKACMHEYWPNVKYKTTKITEIVRKIIIVIILTYFFQVFTIRHTVTTITM